MCGIAGQVNFDSEVKAFFASAAVRPILSGSRYRNLHTKTYRIIEAK